MASIKGNAIGQTIAGNPRYPILDHTFIAIEHPFKVQNPSKAIQSLGGDRKVAKIVAARDSETLETQLSLHPGNYQHNAVISSNAAAKSLVCQVTIPKIIGKKRKRHGGNSPPPVIEAHGLSEQQRLLQTMKDHPNECELKALGQYNRIHKFRTLPDFVYSHQRNKFMHNFNQSIVPLKYEALKQFELAPNDPEHVIDSDLIAPPLFSSASIPFNYAYQQNVSVKVVVGDDGAMTTMNESKIKRSAVQRVPLAVDQIPTEPLPGGPALEEEPQILQEFVGELKALFAERPIWSRRAVHYRFQDHICVSNLRWVFQYVGYEFATGPWAMTVIRYGVDPRKSPDYRMYQSVTLHFEPQARHHPKQPVRAHRGGARNLGKRVERADSRGIAGYIFDGKGLAPDGKTWQICDLEDPILKAITLTTNLRPSCEMTSDGWFKNGTWAKIKVILRYKARCLLYKDLHFEEEDYIQAAEMPDEFDPKARDLPVDITEWSKKAVLLGFHIKNTALQFGSKRGEFTSQDVSKMVRETLAKKRSGEAAIEAHEDQELAALLAEDENEVEEANGSDDMEEEDDDQEAGEDDVEDED